MATQTHNAARRTLAGELFDQVEQSIGGRSVGRAGGQNQHGQHQRNNLAMLKQSAENNGDLLMSNAYMNTNKFHSLGQSATTNEK